MPAEDPGGGDRPGLQLGTTSLALGCVGLGLCWWFPFGPVASLSALGLATASRFRGWGFWGGAFGLAGTGIGLALGWGTWVRLLGV